MKKQVSEQSMLDSNTVYSNVKSHFKPTRKPGFGLVVKYPFDLRVSTESKCSIDPLSRWVAYVNNAGTLCHVVSPESEILIRLSFKKYPIKNLSRQYMRIAIVARIEDWVKL